MIKTTNIFSLKHQESALKVNIQICIHCVICSASFLKFDNCNLLCAVQSGHAGLPHPQAGPRGNEGSVPLRPTTQAGYEQTSETPLPEKNKWYFFKIYTYSP